MKTFWYAQNEDTDSEGFLLQGEAAFEAERAALAEMGAPDTDRIVFRDIQPEDRDTAVCEADTTEALHQWLVNEEMVVEERE